MSDSVSFTVFGLPQPQGSTRTFMVAGKPRTTSDNPKLKGWRQEVAWAAVAAKGQRKPLSKQHGAIVDAKFIFPRPKSQKKGWDEKTTKPDVDKLLRGLCDALTGILWDDDSQVVVAVVSKEFGQPARTEITVRAA